MRDNQPFRLRSHEEDMSSALAVEAESIVKRAAAPVNPGETVKSQMRRASRSLGFGDTHWRVRAAWNREAGCWSAAAMEDLRGRFHEWSARQESRRNADKLRLATLYAALAKQLEESDPSFHRGQIDQLIDMARRLGREHDGGLK